MLPSDIKYFEKCYKEKQRNLKTNKEMPNWRNRVAYKIPDTSKKDDFNSYLELFELVRLYAAIGNGKRVTKKIGEKKYNLLPTIRKSREVKKAKKDGTWTGAERNTRKIYYASDFPVPGLEGGGIDFIKDPHNLTDAQWNCGWISDEEGNLTIMDVGQFTRGEDGLLYDKDGLLKPSRKKRKYEMSKEELEAFKEEKRKISLEKRKISLEKNKEKRKITRKKANKKYYENSKNNIWSF